MHFFESRFYSKLRAGVRLKCRFRKQSSVLRDYSTLTQNKIDCGSRYKGKIIYSHICFSLSRIVLLPITMLELLLKLKMFNKNKNKKTFDGLCVFCRTICGSQDYQLRQSSLAGICLSPLL